MHPTQIGPYRIVKLLGTGGMGQVYEALQEPIQRRVAVKLLLPQFAQHPEALTRFFNEARVVNLVEHPSIVQVSDYGQTQDGAAYLVMECLRGDSLSRRLKQLEKAGQSLPLIDGLYIASQIADALSTAHEKDIVHRDLKPANIMLVRDPVAPGGERAKILDFGIAKLSQGQGSETAANAVIGTPQYMSPEQCRGAGGVDDRTDVYALGVMLYELIAGRTPFLGATGIDYMAQHSFNEPPLLSSFAPNTPPEVVALVHRLLLKDKTQRPAMRTVAHELSALLAGLSAGGRGPLSLSASQPLQAIAPPTPPPSSPSLPAGLSAQGSGPVTPVPGSFLPPAPMSPMLQLPAAVATGSQTVHPGGSSTLGFSSGQTLPPPPSRRRRKLIMLAAGGLGAGLLLLTYGWLAQPTPTASPRPLSPARADKTAAAASKVEAPPAEQPTAPGRAAAAPEAPAEPSVKPKATVSKARPSAAAPRKTGASKARPTGGTPGKRQIPLED
ncbi:MAG TPA: serine/threonine-protein kinase [Pseudomonadota bacterium]|nr:serine/threonine-protein kinase [Pseudomonadota bacterium]